ncbi:tyrosinase family oxidase copper chaperone [Streptomyces sp. KLOTTS4A1]|uniref:tyrosinase family oxidase copper chaperone n=1 Tax=Streptomyces sp. KLOTTS4A1 TaxID=3390996 RepID=UPI0039F563AF
MSERLLDPPAPGKTRPQRQPQPQPVTVPAAAGAGRSLPRRLVVRGLTALVSLGGTAAALSPLLRAKEDGVRSGGLRAGGPALYENGFSEIYRGRHIRGGILPAGDRDGDQASGQDGNLGGGGGRGGTEPGQATVLIDGRSLHVMRRADGTYMTALHHFESFGTLQEAARSAVDSLGASAQPV